MAVVLLHKAVASRETDLDKVIIKVLAGKSKAKKRIRKRLNGGALRNGLRFEIR